MKKHFKTTLSMFLPFLLMLYLGFSLLNLDLTPTKWDDIQRGNFMSIMLISYIACSIVSLIKNHENN